MSIAYSYTNNLGENGTSVYGSGTTNYFYNATLDWIFTVDTISVLGRDQEGSVTIKLDCSNGTSVQKQISVQGNTRKYYNVDLSIEIPRHTWVKLSIASKTKADVYFKAGVNEYFAGGWTGNDANISSTIGCFDFQFTITSNYIPMTIDNINNDGYAYTKNCQFFTGFETDAAGIPLIDGVWRMDSNYNEGYPFLTKYIPYKASPDVKYLLFEKQ